MGSPRDITRNLTRWTERRQEVGGGGEPDPKRQRSVQNVKKKEADVASLESSALPARSVDYFAVFVYSLLYVSLLSQLVIMLTLSIF